jgi:hypothetical protein
MARSTVYTLAVYFPYSSLSKEYCAWRVLESGQPDLVRMYFVIKLPLESDGLFATIP